MSIRLFLKLFTISINNTKIISKNSIKILNMSFYAVAKGRTAGIFMSWPDCEAQVKGFSGARYKKFDTVEAAQKFIQFNSQNKLNNGGASQSQQLKPKYANNKPNNLKRSYSTSPYQQNSVSNESQTKDKPKAKRPSKPDESNDSYFSDDSDDLNTILTKQMDDIEKRVKGFENGIDKIIKKNTSSAGRKTILIEPPQPKRKRPNGAVEFEEDSDGFVEVYTDGACSANGRNGAKAGIGVYWGDGHPLNTSEPVSGRATNNCGEIQAATCAIKQALQNGVKKLAINTDSQFLINSVTKWMPGWKRKGWKLKSGEPVKNEKDFKELDSVQNQLQLKWNYVEAHRGIHGNEMADQLAKAGAAKYNK